ncbi:MAG: GAF sensor signal transduction histidine kinase, partial [Berkelbacteria bacterium GW2011_GWB1_38_5]
LAASMHSLVTVPMITRGQTVGVMSVFTKKQRAFADKDIDLFITIANQAAVAIVSIRSTELLEENRRRLSELEALNQLSKTVSTLFDFDETLYSIIGLITRIFKADKGVLLLFDHNDRLLKATKPAFNLTEAQVFDFRCRSDEGVSGQSFCKGIPLMLNKIDPETENVLSRAKMSDIKSVLVAPLKVKSQTLGVIHILSSKENNFAQDDLRLFSILSSQAAVVVNSSYMYRDIEQERKKDEALLSSIAEGVLAVDNNQKIILLNAAGEKISGFLQEELLGKKVDIIMNNNSHPEPLGEGSSVNAGSADKLPDSSLSARNDNDNHTLLRRDGTIFPARLSVAPIRDADDKGIGKIIVFSDITHELEVEQLKRELISIATHELRTPITGIKGYLDMILSGDTGGVNSETKEVVSEVTAINQKLADLVDDLLNVGRIEQGRIEVKPVAMDLTNSITEALKELSIQAKGKSLEMVFSSPQGRTIYSSSEPPAGGELRSNIMVKADPERVRQILINLIGNAIKYTPAGKSEIRNQKSETNLNSQNPNYAGKIEISLEQKGSEIICHIKDSGIGMDKEAQKSLFTKFYRIKTEKTRQITGTGLGLWICKQIIEMMSGKIWVESAEGKGSTFSFSLPIA